MSDIYDQCVASIGEEASSNELLRCVASNMQDVKDSNAEGNGVDIVRSYLIIHSAVLVFFMQAGFAMLAAGSVRTKNVGNTMLKNLLDACGASFAFFAVGYAFAYGGEDTESPTKTFIGTDNFFLMNISDDALATWVFEYAFAASATTIVAGALAERCQMAAYLCYSVMLTGWVYPLVVHSVWNAQGFLSATSVAPLWGVGFIDFAGSGVVHLTGGITALIAAKTLGPRRGRFHDDTGRKLSTPHTFPGSSTALQMLGCFLLWVGWFGFNTGAALLYDTPHVGALASLAAVNTALSAGMGGLSALFVNMFILERMTGEPFFDLTFAMNGTLSGAVAITGGCALVEPWAAVVIGFLSGILYIASHYGILRFRIDDCVDAIPVHMFNGIWGILAVGFFASPTRLQQAYGRSDHVGWFYSFAHGGSNGTLLAAQCIGTLYIIGWVTVFMLPFFLWLDWRGWLRSDPLEEIVGLDTSYHGGIVLMGDSVQPEYITGLDSKDAAEPRLTATSHAETIADSEMDVRMENVYQSEAPSAS